MILDGKRVSSEILLRLRGEVARLRRRGVQPCLATVLVGKNEASRIYVQQKIRRCQEAGILSRHIPLAQNTSERRLLSLIRSLNKDKRVHAILVQLPLPDGISPHKVLKNIDPKKDVDGFHPENIGRLFSCKSWDELMRAGISIPCTPFGILRLLEAYRVPLRGRRAVVVGRSNIVGKPTAMLLLAKDATVTLCHSKTKGLPEIMRQADILISAVGKPKWVKAHMVKRGAVLVDVGINRTSRGIAGDVDFESVSKKARAVTPVPGGIGPMTIAMLLHNTVHLAKGR